MSISLIQSTFILSTLFILTTSINIFVVHLFGLNKTLSELILLFWLLNAFFLDSFPPLGENNNKHNVLRMT